MEDVMTPPFQGWRATQSLPSDEYSRKPKPTKAIKCKYVECASFASLIERRPAPHALKHKHHKLARQWTARSRSAAKPRFEDALVRELTATLAKATDVALSKVPQDFREAVSRWRNETAHVSSIPDIVMHPSYQKIIRMPKKEIVPLILRELRDGGGFWFPALHAITDANPVDPQDRGNVKKMTQAWLDWGQREGWLLGV